MEKDSRIADFYMFNNSWMINKPIVRGGILCEMSHWNNAIEFTSCGSQGADACRYRPNEPAVDEGIRPYPTANGKALFFDLFGFEYLNDDGEKQGCDGNAGPIRFDYDLSNDGFPAEFNEARSGFEAMYGLEKHGVSGSASFRAPESGDFTWKMGSPTQDAGCAIEWHGKGPACPATQLLASAPVSARCSGMERDGDSPERHGSNSRQPLPRSALHCIAQ
jgi:hypothetical protein